MGTVEVERLGLSLVHSPSADRTAEGQSTHSCNIIFVHGLRGHPQRTWEYKTKQARGTREQEVRKEDKPKQKRGFFSAFSHGSHHRKNSTRARDSSSRKVYWPADLLPKEVPKARIWTYGYDADVITGMFHANNKNSILQHANDLMVKLERTLDDNRPIIFVVHSLGGIIVKRALSEMESSKDESLIDLLNRVLAVIFCGTPHRGASAAAWGSLVSRLAAVALTDSNTRLLSDMEIDSQILDMIQDNFLRTLQYHPSLRVHTFLEGKAMTGVKGIDGKVVDDFSAKIGWSKGARHETIDANHREMVRKPGVKDIIGVLKGFEKDSYSHKNGSIVDTYPNAIPKADLPFRPTTELENSHDTSAVRYPYLEMFKTFNYESTLDNVIEPYQNTCAWISKTRDFAEWETGQGTATFWLHGYPGLGKSVMTKYLLKNVIDTPRTISGSRPFVLYFFCSYQHADAQSLKCLISCLIYQLLSQKPDLAKASKKLKADTGSWIKPDVNSLFDLRRIWFDLVDEFRRQFVRFTHDSPLFIIVDALDELERIEWVNFFTIFNEHYRMKNNPWLRILITSRTEFEIEENMRGSLHVDLGATNQNASDVAAYITGTVSDFGHLNNFGDENILGIVSEITKKAEGMFLWATLAWSLFTDGVGMWTRTLVQQKLEGLRQVPPGIESLYHRVLALVDKRVAGDLLTALKWIVAATIPLTVDQISVALALRARVRHKRELAIPFNIGTFFKKECPHLIKIDGSGTIKLVHLSFKSFLLEIENVKHGPDLVPNSFHFDLKSVNYDVGLDCLSYITLEDFKSLSLFEAQEHTFFSYCHKSWIHHLESIQDGFYQVSVYFFKLLNLETKRLRWYDTSKMIFELWDRGLGELFEPATRLGMNLNVFDDNGDHFIHHVYENSKDTTGKDATIRWLVDLGVDLNGRTHLGQSILHKCLITWHDALSGSLSTPDIASGGAPRELLEMINGNPRKPLEAAVDSARDACKRLLAYPSIDLNVIDKYWFSPLSYTIYWGMKDAMDMLIACPYFQTGKGQSALHVAVKEGSFAAVKQLLARGIEVDGLTSQGETVLHLAAAKGHYRIIQLLVAKANPDLLNAKDRRIDPKNPYAKPLCSTGSNGWTPLHLAVTSGNDDLVLWLINHPWINLNLKDKHGRQAIAFAAAFGSKIMLKSFLSRVPDQVSHKDSFGNSLLHMASLGSNRENFDFLFSLENAPYCGRNKWGNAIVDLAPTLAMDEHLHELGFLHSEERRSSCLRVLDRRWMYESKVVALCHRSKWLVHFPKDESGNPVFSPDVFDVRPDVADSARKTAPSDTLGRRYGNGTYYAID